MKSLNNLTVFAAATIMILSLVGCGSETTDGPARFGVSGTVTFKGNPVPAGSVRFVPDTSAGNSGPATGADIVNGKFTTPSKAGAVGGAHVVTVEGFDGVAIKDSEGGMNEWGSPLFPPYEVRMDLPETAENIELIVPDKN